MIAAQWLSSPACLDEITLFGLTRPLCFAARGTKLRQLLRMRSRPGGQGRGGASSGGPHHTEK